MKVELSATPTTIGAPALVDLYPALSVDPERVTHACNDRHTNADFLSFMTQVAKRHPRVDLLVILDNSSTRSTPRVQARLAKNPRGPLPLHTDERLMA